MRPIKDVSFLSSIQSIVARMASALRALGEIARALSASSIALAGLLSSSARRARSSCASTSLGAAIANLNVQILGMALHQRFEKLAGFLILMRLPQRLCPRQFHRLSVEQGL